MNFVELKHETQNTELNTYKTAVYPFDLSNHFFSQNRKSNHKQLIINNQFPFIDIEAVFFFI